MSDDIFAIAFFSLYVLVFVLAIGAALWKILRPFLAGGLKMKADRAELARGESVNVELDVPPNTRNLQMLIRAEEFYVSGGKHRRTYTETAYEEVKPMRAGVSGRVSHSFEIPKSAPPSIGPYGGDLMDYSRSVGLRWYVYAKADLPNALDREGKVELEVK